MKNKKENKAAYKKVAMVGGANKVSQTEGSNKRTTVKKKKALIISLSFVLVAALILGTVLILLREPSFDYMESDLGQYISISKEDYKNYSLELLFDEVTDADVERKIASLRYQKRKVANNGATMFRVPISLGDTAHIYYRGYIILEDGRKQEIENTSNLLGEAYALGIGSNSFVPGFEEGLIGAVPWDSYLDVEHDRLSSGTVSVGDVIFLSYSVILPDGTSSQKSREYIDLSDEDLDKYYGKGFKEYFTGAGVAVGKSITEPKTFEREGGSAVYCDMKVEYVIRCDNKPITIDARFPADYHQKELRGLTVKFDVYFKSSVIYDVPEYNESFITETLKLTSDDLMKYDGEDIVSKHRSYLLEEAKAQNEASRKTLIEEAMWERYNQKLTVKKYPETEVEEIYDGLYSERATEYQSYYSSMYASLADYIRAYYGLSENADAAGYLLEESRKIVMEKILFYYIIREEGLLPSDEEYKKLYNEAVAEHLDYYLEEIYDDELASIKSEEEKQKRIDEIKKEMMEYYGEEYFKDTVYYGFAYDTVLSYAKIIEK